MFIGAIFTTWAVPIGLFLGAIVLGCWFWPGYEPKRLMPRDVMKDVISLDPPRVRVSNARAEEAIS
jgi:hypothetical protein